MAGEFGVSVVGRLGFRAGESGTDFSAELVVIDPSKEPGFFAKIGAKLFGS